MHADLSDENACVISTCGCPEQAVLNCLPYSVVRAAIYRLLIITAHKTPETLDMARRATYFHKRMDDLAHSDAVAGLSASGRTTSAHDL